MIPFWQQQLQIDINIYELFARASKWRPWVSLSHLKTAQNNFILNLSEVLMDLKNHAVNYCCFYLYSGMVLIFNWKEVEVNATVMMTSHWINIMCQIIEKTCKAAPTPQPTNNWIFNQLNLHAVWYSWKKRQHHNQHFH